MATANERHEPLSIATLLFAPEGRRGRALLRMLTEERGHQVTWLSFPSDVHAACAQRSFHLVVLLWPDASGGAAEVCRLVRQAPWGGKALVLAFVTARRAKHIAAAVAAGADDFIRLPARSNVLDLQLQAAERRIRALHEHSRAEAALQASEERQALAARGANDGFWDWDLRNNQVYFSLRWKELVGWSEGEIGAGPDEWLRRIHSHDVERVQETLRNHLEGLTPSFESEHRLLHRDGGYRWMQVRGLAARRESGKPHRIAGSLSDITARKRLEERLVHDALHDALTGLPNRALFIERLRDAFARAQRHESPGLAVLLLDVDRLNLINDGLGHLAGDKLLVCLGQRLEGLLREGETVARFGGDEFAFLLEDIGEAKQAAVVAERIRSALRQPFDLNGQEVSAAVSIGIAAHEGEYEEPEGLLRDADTAMYRAKALGRDCYAVFDPSMHQRALALLQLENDLRHAIAREELRVFFQPIVALSTGRIAGFEALVRWQHPRRGLLLPAEFIPAAEETGLITPLDRWVLNVACRQARAWGVRLRRQPSLLMSVNISGRAFSQPDLVMQVDHALRASGLYGEVLKLEITESAIMENAQHAAAMLEQLRTLAITVSIDDFGTGYSSLSYLRRFEIDTLKIDLTFVSRMLDDEESGEIVSALINLAFNLRKDIVAEGVETAAQLARLRELGCTHGQGYYFSPPITAEAATEMLTADPRW